MYGQEEKLKAAREAETSAAKCAQGSTAGVAKELGYATRFDDPGRVGIRERVENDLNRASREARKLEQLHELSFLLQKNPEVARILDLIEIVRG